MKKDFLIKENIEFNETLIRLFIIKYICYCLCIVYNTINNLLSKIVYCDCIDIYKNILIELNIYMLEELK